VLAHCGIVHDSDSDAFAATTIAPIVSASTATIPGVIACDDRAFDPPVAQPLASASPKITAVNRFLIEPQHGNRGPAAP
jgi:hypothetical protein